MKRPRPDRLFAALDATWPAARYVWTGPWTLREGLGGGQRVSAATAEGQIDESAIDTAEKGMRDLGQTPLFMIRNDDQALDAWLAQRGYDIVDPVTMYLTPVRALAEGHSTASVTQCWPPLAIQREIWSDAGIGPARIEVMNRVSVTKSALLGRKRDTPGGTVFIATDGDVAMMHALEVLPAERRNGIGRQLLIACASWAASSGANWLALAVVTANAPANTLYRNSGMEPAATYHYRRASAGSE